MKIERKDFLKLGGGTIVGGLAGYVFSGAPFQAYQMLAEWTQDQLVPKTGVENFIKSMCEACPDKCSMTIRMISDRAVKVETSNNGCPIGQNILQLLYHPERIHAPLKRTGKKGKCKLSNYKEVSWKEALTDIAGKLDSASKNKKGTGIAAISGEFNYSSQLLEKFIKGLGSSRIFCEPSINTLTSAALGGSIEYDLSNTDFVLSFGARLFEGWGNPGTMNKALNRWKEKGTKIIQIDTLNTRTASMADEWIPIKPGTEAILAMGIANHLITNKYLVSKADGFARWSEIIINHYPLITVSKLTGVDIKKIKEIGNLFAKAKNPIAVCGKGAKGVSSTSSEILSVYGLNNLVKSKAVKIAKSSSVKNGLDGFIKNENFEFLFVNDADPVYKSVFGSDLKKKMEKAFVVSIMPLLNDTGAYSDYILPSLSFLEKKSTGDKGVTPEGKSTHSGDIIISLAKKTGKTKKLFPWKNYTESISTLKKETIGKGKIKFSFDVTKIRKQMISFKKAKKTDDELYLIPYEIPSVGDGDGLAFPYVHKALDDKTFLHGKLICHINKKTAKKHGITEGESIDITNERGKIKNLVVHITDTISPNVIAIPLGFGHKAYTKYASGKGVNPKEIMADDIDPLSGSANWWSTKVKIS